MGGQPPRAARARPRAGRAARPADAARAAWRSSPAPAGTPGSPPTRPSALGLELPPLGEAASDRLRELLPEAATVANPLDYTSLLWAETELLREIVATVGADPAIDQLLVFHDTPEELSAEATAVVGGNAEPGSPADWPTLAPRRCSPPPSPT